MAKSSKEDSPTKPQSRSFSVRVENYLEACRVCMTLPPKKGPRSEQFWNIFSAKAAGSDQFLVDALSYITGKEIDKNENLFPQTVCPKCVVDINTVFKPLHDLKSTIKKTDQNWKAFKKERLKQNQNIDQQCSYQITEYVVEADNEEEEEEEEEPEAMDAVSFLLKNMTQGSGKNKNEADDDDDDDDLDLSYENEAPPELEEQVEMIVPDEPEKDVPTIFTIIDGPTQRIIKKENNLLVAPPSPPRPRKPYERRPKPDEPAISYEERRHVCEVCQKRFLKKSNLIDHLRLHANMKIFKCDFCERSFVQMGNYKQHLRTHTEEKPYTCEFCNKCYTQSSALKIHKRTHTGERSYVCNECGKKFTNASDLRKHGILHDPLRKLRCEFCDRYFSQKVHLKNHLQRAHQSKQFDLKAVVDRANAKVLAYIRGAEKLKTRVEPVVG